MSVREKLNEPSTLSRFTFWIVFGQAVLVITLLAVTLVNVTQQTSRAEAQSSINEQLIQQNNDLIIELRQNQASLRLAMVQSMFCMLEVRPEDRTPDVVAACMDIFLESEAAQELGG